MIYHFLFFVTMGLNIKILFAMVVMIGWYSVLILAILLPSLLKELSTIHDISKCDVIFLLENSVLDDSGYILNASQRNQY